MSVTVIPAKAGTSARQRLDQMSRDPGFRRGDALLGAS
jgi:hypothetical protein